MSPDKTSPLVFLTLGDGDFSFSLDLATYLSSDSRVHSPSQDAVRDRPIRLVATGIDSADEVIEKYRDSQFILNKLRVLDESDNLSVSVQHEVNAVADSAETTKTNETTAADAAADAAADDSMRADYVIFNHPHIGTEDAVRHARFLCHLFHAVSKRWLQEGGLFHMTLVKGQFERWECEKAASSAGNMILVDKCDFQTPPISDPKYQHRRHQTGKSFESRARGGSETVTFARKDDDARLWRDKSPRPIWYKDKGTESTENTDKLLFECPHCDRTFKEERSVKNHVKSKHATDHKKRKRDTETFVCTKCQPEPREFESPEALQDHIHAKHNALHAVIAPDWYRESQPDDATATSIEFGECKVCRTVFRNATEKEDHEALFVPTATSPLVNEIAGQTFNCSFCSKSFREKRAQLQHENRCPTRTS